MIRYSLLQLEEAEQLEASLDWPMPCLTWGQGPSTASASCSPAPRSCLSMQLLWKGGLSSGTREPGTSLSASQGISQALNPQQRRCDLGPLLGCRSCRHGRSRGAHADPAQCLNPAAGDLWKHTEMQLSSRPAFLAPPHAQHQSRSCPGAHMSASVRGTQAVVT